MNSITSNILLGISFLLVYFAIKQFYKTNRILLKGVKTKGKVIDLIAQASDDNETYKPIFQYKNKSGEIVEFTSSVSTNPPAYKIGEEVSLVYLNHKVKIISFWGLYRWSVILLTIASPLLVICLSHYLYELKFN